MRGAQQREFERGPGTRARVAILPWLARPSAFEAAARARHRAVVGHGHGWPQAGLGTDNGQKGGG